MKNNMTNTEILVIIEALQNDTYLKVLYEKLNDLYLKSIPKTIQISTNECKVIYEDEFDTIIASFHKEINFRREQIIFTYTKGKI